MIDRYINFYNYERIQLKTGVAPLTLHHSAYYFIFPYIEAFWCCPHNLGRFKMSRTFSVLFMPFYLCPFLFAPAQQLLHRAPQITEIDGCDEHHNQ